jgi:hypothetical protein
MSLSDLIKELDKLPLDESLKVYSYLKNKLEKKERILQSLNEIRGIGKGVWDMDAQEYINKERDNDRI